MQRWRQRVDERLGDPIWWNDVLQLVKTVLAAVAAWVIAASLLELPQPFLAPWAALLVVHATVYRTFSKGMQQVAATVVAVVLASVVGRALGLDAWALTVLLAIALVLGAVPWLGAEATTIATTALVVLTTGFESDVLIISRLLDTAIGVGVGLLVNVIVWPPLRRHTAAKALDRIDDQIGELLVDMAGGLGDGCQDEDVAGWIERTRDIDADLDQAWALVRQAQESARLNPRRQARAMRNPEQWHGLLRRLEQAVAETRSLARTLGGQRSHRETWGEGFADPWISMLHDAGRATGDADPDALLDVRARLEGLTDALRSTERSAEWPVYGALIINLRNIIDSMDRVAEAQPIGGPGLPLRVPVRRRGTS
ncbi:aromatic acid exporter family protein [Nocardioides flavus (ex Wang et al. 2016)]